MAGGLFGGGDGSLLTPFLVEDALDLDAVRSDLTAHYKQTADIDLASWGNWTPIGFQVGQFEGSYDGDGYSIINLSINEPTEWYVGLFFFLMDAVIEKLIVQGSCVGLNTVGLLAGNTSGNVTLKRCFAFGSVVSENDGGLLVGCFDGEAEECVAAGEVTVSESSSIGAGGMVGFAGNVSNAVFTNCYAIVDVKGSQGQDKGGFIGRTNASALGFTVACNNCYSAGLVEGADSLGGFCGYDASLIANNCYYDSNLSGLSDNDNAAPKTTAQMKDKNTFATWDFINTWRIDPRIKTGFPVKGPVVYPGIKPGSFKQKNEGYPFLR